MDEEEDDKGGVCMKDGLDCQYETGQLHGWYQGHSCSVDWQNSVCRT